MKSQPEQIQKVIKVVIEDLRSGKKFREGQVLEAWFGVVGKRMLKHTRPVMVKNGRLLVNVDRSVWLYELTRRHKERLLKRLQKKIGKDILTEIQFRIGEV